MERRLKALRLAETLGNVTQACRLTGVDRTSFYKWKRRYALDDVNGLRDRPTIAKTNSQTTSEQTQQQVLRLAEENPGRGSSWLAKVLEEQGIRLSPPTIRKIIRKQRGFQITLQI